MTYAETCKAVLSAKGIEHGFITHIVELHKNPKATRNAGGGFNSSHDWQERYRVVLYMDRQMDVTPGSPTNGRAKGGMAEAENADLATAVRECFSVLSLELPESMRPPAPKKK